MSPPMKAPSLALACLLAASGSCFAQPLQPQPGALAELEVRRDANAMNACDIHLYLRDAAVAQLAPGQAVALDLPAGEQVLALRQAPSGHCAGPVGRAQSILLQPGERRSLRIMQSPTELYLAPAPD